MILKYNIEITQEEFNSNLIRITNQIYKLLPLREEGQDWEKFSECIILEIKGLNSLVGNRDLEILSVVSKLEGLKYANTFSLYRRTVFECLNLLGKKYE